MFFFSLEDNVFISQRKKRNVLISKSRLLLYPIITVWSIFNSKCISLDFYLFAFWWVNMFVAPFFVLCFSQKAWKIFVQLYVNFITSYVGFQALEFKILLQVKYIKLVLFKILVPYKVGFRRGRGRVIARGSRNYGGEIGQNTYIKLKFFYKLSFVGVL